MREYLIFHLQYQNKDKVIDHLKYNCIFVVGGNDILIRDQYNLKANSYSHFGNGFGSFAAPEGLSSKDSIRYLAGAH